MKNFLFFIFYLIFPLFCYSQCSMCRTTVENNLSSGESNLALGLNIGILYLFFSPYILFFIFLFFCYRNNF
jgi:hypothetical protein